MNSLSLYVGHILAMPEPEDAKFVDFWKQIKEVCSGVRSSMKGGDNFCSWPCVWTNWSVFDTMERIG